jgi:hypothetical protein
MPVARHFNRELKQRFHREKIYLARHSWGAQLGTHAIQGEAR